MSYVCGVLEVGTRFDVLIYPAFSRVSLPKETLSNVDLEGRSEFHWCSVTREMLNTPQ